MNGGCDSMDCYSCGHKFRWQSAKVLTSKAADKKAADKKAAAKKGGLGSLLRKSAAKKAGGGACEMHSERCMVCTACDWGVQKHAPRWVAGGREGWGPSDESLRGPGAP